MIPSITFSYRHAVLKNTELQHLNHAFWLIKSIFMPLECVVLHIVWKCIGYFLQKFNIDKTEESTP